MSNNSSPLIPSETSLPEITVKVIVLSAILALILAMSNAYLALKIGILVSTSIPAAIISMGVFRLIRQANILENNLVQTAASAGGAVAGGVVYTTPALILIHFWQSFSYWETFFIALSGGLLGVLLSIPLRRVLVSDPALPFPEGRAIAEVLIAGSQRSFGFREIAFGGAVGALIELAQVGFKVLANSAQAWWFAGKTVFGFGMGFSATMLGVGYLIGFNIGVSLLIGAIIGWLFGIPILGFFENIPTLGLTPTEVATTLLSEKLRYVGVGAMLFAGLCTLGRLLKPFVVSIQEAALALRQREKKLFACIPRAERDVPLMQVMLWVILLLISVGFFLDYLYPWSALGLSSAFYWPILMGSLFYIVVVGFIISAITGYFSGMVGVSASPGSAVLIATLLLAAIIMRMLLGFDGVGEITESKMAGAVITIILGALITGIGAIANDNIQDLKTGHLLGATPWKQQVMLMFGVVLSAAVIPLIMQLLFDVYGIGDVLPRADMDPSLALPAPPAAMMAAVAQGIFNYNLPWSMISIGALIIAIIAGINRFLLPYAYRLSLLGIALGIYLPLATTIPLFIGGLLALFTRRRLKKLRSEGKILPENEGIHWQRGVLITCGIVAGSALMDIVLAIPFALSGNPDIWQLLPSGAPIPLILACICTLSLCIWIYRAVCYGHIKPQS